MLPETGNKLPAAMERAQNIQDYAAVIALALKSELGSSHRAVKTLMRWTGAGERTAKNWLAARRGPSGQHLIALVHHSDEVMRAFLVLAGRPSTTSASRAELRSLLSQAINLLDA